MRMLYQTSKFLYKLLDNRFEVDRSLGITAVINQCNRCVGE